MWHICKYVRISVVVWSLGSTLVIYVTIWHECKFIFSFVFNHHVLLLSGVEKLLWISIHDCENHWAIFLVVFDWSIESWCWLFHTSAKCQAWWSDERWTMKATWWTSIFDHVIEKVIWKFHLLIYDVWWHDWPQTYLSLIRNFIESKDFYATFIFIDDKKMTFTFCES